MFRLNRHKSDRLGERVEFKFSNFQAFKVPNGWDKLFVSVISVKTGKTIAKSNKVTVRSGTCQWTDSLSESFGLSQDGGMKELEELKFVVSMGIGRATILGEVVVNLADHIDSSDSGPLTLPLINCSYGTILQVKIQCFNPKTRFRDGNALRGANARLHNLHANSVEADNKYDTSDNINYRSVGSTFSNSSIAEGSEKKDAICLPSGSHGSSDSTMSSLGRTGLTPKTTVNDSTYMGRQDSAGSQASATSSSGPNGVLSRSNPSSFNSRASGSSTPHQWQDSTMQTIAQGHAAQSLGTSVSAKELLEAAEETIDELRDEAKMWERHAQKLKIDLEKLKKECTYKSKQQAELEIELAAANNELDSLRQEVKQLKLSLEQIKISWMDNYSYKNESILLSQKQLEDELKFLKESNTSLSMQLNKSQEANLELVAILEELEETVEKQRTELANLTCSMSTSDNAETMRDQALADAEEEWARKLSAKEDEISRLEETLSKLQNVMHVRTMVSNHDHPDVMQLVEDLRTKVEDLERDCNELTQENLELIFKLKELGKDVDERKDLDSFYHDMHGIDSSQSDVRQLKFQISRLEGALSKRGIDGFINIEPSMLLVEKLRKNCADLEFQLQYVKDHACDPDIKFDECQVKVKEKVLDINELQQKPNCIEDANLGYSIGIDTEQGLEIVKSRITLETPKLLYEMSKQLQLALLNVRYLSSEQDLIGENFNELCSNIMVSKGVDAASQEELVQDMLNDIIRLNSSLQAKVVKCRDIWPIVGGGIMEKGLISGRSEVVESGIMDKQQKEELERLKLRNEELEAAFLLKEKEIDALEASMRELEDMILSIRREKRQVEENLAVAQKENNITTKYVDGVQNEMVILSNDMDSHAFDNDKLDRKSSEHEIGKHEPDLQMSELVAENSQLSERISGLEAQISYLIDEKEGTRLEMEGYKSLVGDLYVETAEQKAKIEVQNVEHGKIYQEVQHELSEAREESEMLKKTHSELQCTVESLIEECSSLKQQAENLQRQKLEMHAQSLDLMVEIRELQMKNSGYLLKVEALESKLSSLQSDFTLKEESIASVLENMLQEQKKLQEMLSEADVMLKKINEEKKMEIEDLKEEVSHFSMQVYSSQNERERLAADAFREVSTLRLEKNKLESSLQEFQAKVNINEAELHSVESESEKKVEGLANLLNASKQSEEMLMADIERLQRTMESLKSSEESFKKMANELELKLKSSEYEKQQTMEDISGLKAQLMKAAEFQDELLNLESFLKEAKFEKEKLEDLLHSVSEECKKLKAEKMLLSDEILFLQKALNDCEADRLIKVSLEEKILRLEADLTAREDLHVDKEGMTNEINRIMNVNNEYLRKIQCLEEEKDELMRKGLVIDKEEVCSKKEVSEDKAIVVVESSLLGSVEEPQVKIEAGALESKVLSLQAELAEALEAKNICQKQLNEFLSNKNSETEIPNNSASQNSAKVDQASRLSSLETELKEMRERYLHMSLQYAEVEAQREELVMQLKSTKKEKRWFS